MMTKNRIRLFIALAVILVVGFTITSKNLRPVSDRKKNNKEKVDYKTEFENTIKQINAVTEEINSDNRDSKLLLNRARLYKSINKFDNAIVDYNNFIKNTDDESLKSQALKELKSCENIKNHLDKVKS